MTTATFPHGQTLAEARALLVGSVVSVATVRLEPGEQAGTMLAPPIDKIITNVTRTSVILDGGTRRHTSVQIATGATARKNGVVVRMAQPHAAHIRTLLGVAEEPIPPEAPPRPVRMATIKAIARDLNERNPLPESILPPPARVVMDPDRHSPAQVLDVLCDLRADTMTLYRAALDTLGRVAACPCGKVSTVCDRVARQYVCDDCAPDHAKANDQPWAPLARAVGRLTSLPGEAP